MVGGIYALRFDAGPITGCEPPTILAVASKSVRITQRVFALDVSRPPAVFKIVATLLTHEPVPDAFKVDPGVRKLMNEQGACIQKIVTEKVFPLVCRGPGCVASRQQGMRGRCQT